MVSINILLGGGSLVLLSRGSWAQEDQIQEENSSFGIVEDQVIEAEPEIQTLVEPVIPSADLNRGTLSYGFYVT